MSDPTIAHTLVLAQQAAQAQPTRPLASRPEDLAAARHAAEEFEAVFLSQMLEHMFAGIRTDGPFDGGAAEGTYRSLLINEYGRMMAQAGGVGLADQVMAEILRIQEDAK